MEDNDIYYANLDPPTGREQGGKRPVVVVKVLSALNLCIIVPLTTAMDRLQLQYTMFVKKTGSTNIGADSVALIFHVRTISNERLSSKVGVLEGSHAKKIKSLMKDMFNIQ